MDPELLLKVSPGLDGEDASVHFLTKHVFRLLGGTTTFEERESLENSFFFIVKLLWGQADIEGAGVQKCAAVVMFFTEVRRTRELRTYPSCHWRWYRQGRCVWYGQRGEICH